jgi:hypothetical protein
VRKFVPLQHRKNDERENAERRLTPYIIPSQIGKKEPQILFRDLQHFPSTQTARSILSDINTRSYRCLGNKNRSIAPSQKRYSQKEEDAIPIKCQAGVRTRDGIIG